MLEVWVITSMPVSKNIQSPSFRVLDQVFWTSGLLAPVMGVFGDYPRQHNKQWSTPQQHCRYGGVKGTQTFIPVPELHHLKTASHAACTMSHIYSHLIISNDRTHELQM